MGKAMRKRLVCSAVFIWMNLFLCGVCTKYSKPKEQCSALGDPGMKRDGLRVAFEAWNFCNEVGFEAPGMGSPRAADCFDVLNNSTLIHKVSEAVNKLGVGTPFKGMSPKAQYNTDLYAVEKELYLGSLCQVEDESNNPWQFWMVMLKNGNLDTKASLCPENGKHVPPFTSKRFPCFGKGCMNQPIFNHEPTKLLPDKTMKGWFNGTYDLDAKGSALDHNISYYEVVWEKKLGYGGWAFHHKLRTSPKYPWLMLYLRADATKGFSGGYHYETRGMMKTLPESNFKVKITLDIRKGGGNKSQFYLIDIGSCWKNDGSPCDGDVLTDVTRYSEMIINPATQANCNPNSLQKCPPYHITSDNRKIHRNDTANFPYEAYHYYCAPGNAKHAEQPYESCDPYSNPQAQELVQLLPHPIWDDYGYPTKKGQGWVGDPRTWTLNTGAMASKLYFYQDPGTAPAKRIWTSIDMGTEIYVSDHAEDADWTLSDFDIILT